MSFINCVVSFIKQTTKKKKQKKTGNLCEFVLLRRSLVRFVADLFEMKNQMTNAYENLNTVQAQSTSTKGNFIMGLIIYDDKSYNRKLSKRNMNVVINFRDLFTCLRCVLISMVLFALSISCGVLSIYEPCRWHTHNIDFRFMMPEMCVMMECHNGAHRYINSIISTIENENEFDPISS